MKKFIVIFLCCMIFLVGCSTVAGESLIKETTQSKIDNKWLLSLEGIGKDTVVSATYDKDYKSIVELLSASTLIVRATPISIESESAFALCWVLQVAESDQDNIKTVRLRQLKDEYLLELGQEVVLALQPDAGEGYYNIPGGGCGIFQIDNETATVRGKLLNSLMEHSSNTAALTLENVFDMLLQLRK